MKYSFNTPDWFKRSTLPSARLPLLFLIEILNNLASVSSAHFRGIYYFNWIRAKQRWATAHSCVLI